MLSADPIPLSQDDSAGAVPTSGPDGLYRVRIVGEEGVRRFAKLVGFVSEGKARLLEAALRRPQGFEANWFFPHVDQELERIGFGGRRCGRRSPPTATTPTPTG